MHLTDSDMSVCFASIIYEEPEGARKGYRRRTAKQRGRDTVAGERKDITRKVRKSAKESFYSQNSEHMLYCRWTASLSCTKGLHEALWKLSLAQTSFYGNDVYNIMSHKVSQIKYI